MVAHSSRLAKSRMPTSLAVPQRLTFEGAAPLLPVPGVPIGSGCCAPDTPRKAKMAWRVRSVVWFGFDHCGASGTHRPVRASRKVAMPDSAEWRCRRR